MPNLFTSNMSDSSGLQSALTVAISSCSTETGWDQGWAPGSPVHPEPEIRKIRANFVRFNRRVPGRFRLKSSGIFRLPVFPGLTGCPSLVRNFFWLRCRCWGGFFNSFRVNLWFWVFRFYIWFLLGFWSFNL